MFSLVAPVLAGVVAALGMASPARGQIISHIDEKGRRVFVNGDAQSTPRPTSSAGGSHLVTNRRAQMPGIDQHIGETARQHQIDPKLVYAIITVESSWDPWAVSRKGAVGLMQLVPETGQRFGARNLLEPKENITAGVRYLRFLLDRFRNNVRFALAAYNAGENIVTELGGVPPYPETQDFVERVSSLYRHGGGHAFRASGLSSPADTGRIYPEVDENGRIVFANF